MSRSVSQAIEQSEVVIVGAGPAGLATAACLMRRGVPFILLEAADVVGASWRRHYERLRLHTVKEHSALPYVPFPKTYPRYPSREQFFEYLQAYAARFSLAPRLGEALIQARRGGDGWELETTKQRYRTRHLVMATGYNRVPRRPTWPGQAEFAGSIVHSADYKNGSAYRGQEVLVVGIGNTGAEIAIDLHEHGAKPTFAVRTPTNILPRDFLGPMQVTSIRTAYLPVWLRDRLGRAVARAAFGDLRRIGVPLPDYGPATQMLRYKRTPLIDVGTVALIRAGHVRLVGAPERFTPSGVRFADGREQRFDAVILATGYAPGLAELIDAPGLIDESGTPRQKVGNPEWPGLYFIGLDNVITGLLREIGRDAQRIAALIAEA